MTTNGVAAIGAAFVLLCFSPSLTSAADVAKAKRDLMSARTNAETGRWGELDASMKKALASMEGLSDAQKAPLLAEVQAIKAMVTKSIEEDVTKRLDRVARADPGMAKLDLQRADMRLKSDEAAYADPAVLEKLRARLASMTGGGTTPEPKPRPDTTTAGTGGTSGAGTSGKAMSYELQTAAARMRTARGMLEQGDRRIAESLMKQAIKLVENVPEAEKAPLLADVVDLNQKIEQADLKAQRDEEFRRINEQVGRYVRTAETSIRDGLVSEPEWIDKSEQLLATHPAQTYLGADRIKEYQKRLDDTRAKLKAHNKKVSIERSADILKELEDKVAADPFKGADETTAPKIFSSLKYLGQRVRGEFTRVPKDDPDIKAVLDRVAAADAKIEAAAGKWATGQMEEQFAAGWAANSKGFEGWEAEKLSQEEAPRGRMEGLGKTAQAVRGTVYWLNDADTKRTAEQYKDNQAVAATLAAARKTLDQAAARLNEGYNAVLAALEQRPMPQREADRSVAPQLMHSAKDWFAGTQYQEANVARAKALDEKWKAEVARIEKERAETLKKMTAEAAAAWPRIAATVSAEGFDASAASDAERLKGKTIRIRGYYNRSGWDFDAMYDFAADVKGVPVGATFAPHVREAYRDIQQKSHGGVRDHADWDVIAVVEGPGKINRRVTTEWKDQRTRELLFKTEGHVAEPCVLLRIVGVHTGPLAVGPK